MPTAAQVDFGALPDSLLSLVLGSLSVSDVCASRGACRLWRTAKPLWRKLSSRYLTDVNLARVSQLCVPCHMFSVNLAANFKVTNTGLVHLAAFPNLQQLNLENCNKVTDAGLVHVAELCNLQQLRLSSCRKITDGGLVHLIALPRLRKLELIGCDLITDAALALVQCLESLEWLDLRYCKGVTKAIVLDGAALRALRR